MKKHEYTERQARVCISEGFAGMKDIYNSGHGEFRLNDVAIAEMLLGVPDEKRIGRIVQVRKGAGAFKSDLIILKLSPSAGTYAAFENVLLRRADDKQFDRAFYQMNGQNPPVIPEMPEPDEPDLDYSLAGGAWPEIGFIVESPKQPDSPQQSFGMIVTKP